jgi:hypothetical protein
MPEVAALDAEIKQVGDMLAKIDAAIWAICSPYEAYGTDQLNALGERIVAAAMEARKLEASRNELYDRLDQLWRAHDAIVYAGENV